MKPIFNFSTKFMLVLFIETFMLQRDAVSQTAFTAPVMSTQTGASNSFNSVVIGPETVGSGCAEMGQNWAHNFTGTANKRLNGFTITGTNYYVNNYGSLNTIMRRNNASGLINNTATSCAPPAPVPWHDRQIMFFEGTRDLTTNVASIVNTFPSLTLPGNAGYDNVNEMNLVFSRGFINSGADNIFNNNSGTGSTSSPTINYNSNANNIERMDVFISGGILVTAANLNRVGFVVACRGPADDPFVLSAIKGLSGGSNIGGGTNYIYDNIIKVNANWTTKTINGGAGITIPAGARVTVISGMTSVVLRRMDSDAIMNDQLPLNEYPTISSYVTAQNIVAMFFTFADLGLVAGDIFYGYSVAAFDVTAVTSDQLNSYTNSTYFPLTTSPADGGVDLSGFPGMFGTVDIDDDDDGLPDYLESNISAAFQDHDSDGILNYSDPTYPGFTDLNADGINDNFDPSADSDNDTNPNYLDSSFPGFTDTNSDGVNDAFDKDRDGISNHLDLDSDNDGIPDTAESFGVDANGDGRIDNYTDTDADGLSQNVDATSTGAADSGPGLGGLDTDGDTVPNYLDLDSDNDGIPDVVEVHGTDMNNDGKMDSYTNADLDGFSGNVDGDADNDGTAENSSSALLRTGSDGNNDGRCDNFPYKNIDNDSKPNPYDVDSDMDGIIDVIEASFNDADNNGVIDGTFNSDGWSTIIAAMGTLTLPNSDGLGRENIYDIDSDDDGIPDNIEGLPTTSYLLPSGADTDSDGLDNSYDNTVGFSGNGIPPVDTDLDLIPDYIDLDTDSDGLSDIVEGNDFNLNGEDDDDVTPDGIDTDADGLDDHFDSDNTGSNGTSARMGNGGSFTGSATPGSITTVQRTLAIAQDRDWRWIDYILECNYQTFFAVLKNNEVLLDWTVYCRQAIDYFEVERSIDGIHFETIQRVEAYEAVGEIANYNTLDDVSSITQTIIYYRLKAIGTSRKTNYSSVVSVRKNLNSLKQLIIAPNPVRGQLQFSIKAEKDTQVEVLITDANGRTVLNRKQGLQKGFNNFTFAEVRSWQAGTYYMLVYNGEIMLTSQFILTRN